MQTKTRDELVGELDSNVKAAREIAAKAEGESRDLTPEERTAVMKAIEDARGAKNAILALDGDAAIRRELSVLGDPVGDLAKAGDRSSLEGRKSLGERFTENEAVTDWLKAVGRTRSEKAAVGTSPAVGFGMKDLVTGASPTSAGGLVTNDWRGLLDGLSQFARPLTIVDLVTRGQTGSDTVEYARVTGFTNNAAPVPEATSSATPGLGGVAVGAYTAAHGAKPESGLALEKVTAAVKTIAHWLPATKRALSDAAQIRTLIDEFLRYGLDEELEDQILTGDDTDENFEGILEVDGIQSMPWDTDLLTTTRKARTLVRTVGRARPTAFVFHPNDNERIDLLKNSNGDFYFGGPTSNPSAPLWGLPRVESEAMPEGTGMVADWRMAVLWDREEASIAVSDSHADFFVRNLVAILGELRAAFGVIRPKAFVSIDLEAGS